VDNARLLATIEKHADRSKEARQARSELEIARHVQQRLLPQHAQALTTATYGGRCLPAREIGGDYYDFLELGPSRLGVMLADVSGKGVAGALLTATLQASFRSQLELGVRHLKALLASVNKLFYESTRPSISRRCSLPEYRDQGRELRYVNCGHPAAVVMRRNRRGGAPGSHRRCPSASSPLSNARKKPSHSRRRVLLIFSDGVLEAGIDHGDEFGEARLIDAARAARVEMWTRCSTFLPRKCCVSAPARRVTT